MEPTKKALIKAVAGANLPRLNKFTEETEGTSVSQDNLILAFKYLIANGQPEGFGDEEKWFSYHEFKFVETDFATLEESLKLLNETGGLAAVSVPGLDIFLGCIECYLALKRNDKLHLLNPFKKVPE